MKGHRVGFWIALLSVIESIIVFDLLIPLSTCRILVIVSMEHKTFQKKFNLSRFLKPGEKI